MWVMLILSTAQALRRSITKAFLGWLPQTVCLALTLPLAIGLAMLLGWNLYLALSNKTTIEFHEGVTASIQARRSCPRPLHAHCTPPTGSCRHACIRMNISCVGAAVHAHVSLRR